LYIFRRLSTYGTLRHYISEVFKVTILILLMAGS